MTLRIRLLLVAWLVVTGPVRGAAPASQPGRAPLPQPSSPEQVVPALSLPMSKPVSHEPLAPKPDVPVLVSAKLTEGATKVTLKLQVVASGKYVRKSDPEYEKD